MHSVTGQSNESQVMEAVETLPINELDVSQCKISQQTILRERLAILEQELVGFAKEKKRAALHPGEQGLLDMMHAQMGGNFEVQTKNEYARVLKILKCVPLSCSA